MVTSQTWRRHTILLLLTLLSLLIGLLSSPAFAQVTDTEPPTVTWVQPVGNGQTYTTSSNNVTLKVEASDPSGIGVIELWLHDPASGGATLITQCPDSPCQASLDISNFPFGQRHEVSADVSDNAGNWAFESIFIERLIEIPPPPEPPKPAPPPGFFGKLDIGATIIACAKARQPLAIAACIIGALAELEARQPQTPPFEPPPIVSPEDLQLPPNLPLRPD